MITVNFVDSVQKTFYGDSIVWVAGANIIDVIKELAEKYNLDPYSIANFRYVVNGKDIPQKKFAKIKLKPRDGIMIMPQGSGPIKGDDEI